MGGGAAYGQKDGRMDIRDSRVAFATENLVLVSFGEERNCGSFVLLQFWTDTNVDT